MAGAILGGRPEEDLGVEASRRGGSGRVGEADEEGGGGLPFAGLVLRSPVAVLLVCRFGSPASGCYGAPKGKCVAALINGEVLLKLQKNGFIVETKRSSWVVS